MAVMLIALLADFFWIEYPAIKNPLGQINILTVNKNVYVWAALR